MLLSKRIGKCEVEFMIGKSKPFDLELKLSCVPSHKLAIVRIELIFFFIALYFDWFPTDEYPFDITKDFGGEKA